MKKLIIFLAFILLISGHASANTRYVNETGWWLDTFNASATPISSAISNSTAYDTVYVYNGSYNDIITIAINNFTLQGESSDVVTLLNDVTIGSGANYFNLSGFNITGASTYFTNYANYINISYNKFTYSDWNIYDDGSYNTYLNNSIIGVTGGWGIMVGYGGGSNSYFANNEITGASVGISILNDNNLFENNIIEGNTVDVSLGDVEFDELTGMNNRFFNGSIGNYSIYGIFGTCINSNNYCNNSFINTNFSVGSNRTITYRHAYYDYIPGVNRLNTTNNDIQIISYASASGAFPITGTWKNHREILSLSKTNVSFIETPVSLDAGINKWSYYISKLSPLSNYHIYRNGVFYSKNQTDSNGALPLFSSDGITTNKIDIINYGNFSFTKSNSESQIYQSSQATIISADITDIDGTISSATVGITFNGVETNYTMTQSGTLWSYSFISGVPGTYIITNFYAVDNSGNNNNSVWNEQFVVVPVSVGGGSEEPVPIPTISPTPTTTPQTNVTVPGGGGGGGGITIPLPEWLPKVIDVRDVASDPTGMMFLYLILLLGLVMILSNLLDGGKVGSLLMGIFIMGISAYALGWFA